MPTLAEKLEGYQQVVLDKVIGKIVPAHDSEGHKYKFIDTGTTVRSVTTKIIIERPHLVPWAVRVAFEWMEEDGRWASLNPVNRDAMLQGAQLASIEVRDDAGDLGHKAHQAIEDYAKAWMATGQQPKDIRTFILQPADPRVFAVARAAESAFKQFGVQPVAAEILVGDESMGTAGTLDMLVMNKQGELELWDWKTSNNVHDSYALQTSAYAYFFEQMTGLPISKVRIVHLLKDTAVPVMYEVPDREDALEAFHSISKVYDYLYNGKQKLVKEVKTLSL